MVDEAVTDQTSSELHYYRLFGGVLASDVEIPELERVQPTLPAWSLRSAIGSPAAENGEELGSDVVTGDVRVRLFRQSAGFRLLFDDTGSFDISAAGDQITWTHPTDVSLRSASADLTSRVMAAALYAARIPCLHGSAVVTDGVAIAFVAPKYHGKSTLALALVHCGAKLLTDDTLPIELEGGPTARPGLHATRLWEDSAARVALGRARDRGASGKQVFSALPSECVTYDSYPLAAVYLLAPVREPRGSTPVWRTQLSHVEAALALIGHGKLAPLLGGSEAPHLFRSSAALAATVPVYRLNVVRDYDCLSAVAGMIRSWHERAEVLAEL